MREKADNPDLVFELQKRGNIGVQQIYQTNPGLAAAVNKTVDMLLPVSDVKRSGIQCTCVHRSDAL